MNKSKQIILILVLLTVIIFPIFIFSAYTPLEALPGYKEPASGESQLTNYLSALFNYAIATAAILAVVMIVIGGLQYIGAAGNTSVIEDAKDRIYWAIVGLILALGSWLILNTINPQLKELKLEGIEPVNTTKEKLELLKLQGKFQTDIDIFSAKKCEEISPNYKECASSQPNCEKIGNLYCRYENVKELGSCDKEEEIKICKNQNKKCVLYLKDLSSGKTEPVCK